ncbi:protoporphyrinogen oxidase [Chitinophaga solisilvae]|uniref:protoporphyrinogen oxidase n=1 Tax=Chitinophaga solisilvae TaxID=1233460 RepID=UPI00136C72A0|nr:protoporphyrinogen oxidase [Chitinophaga solisilvae]
MPQEPVLIIGAGISGLSIAYELQQLQIPYVLTEAAPAAGGVIRSLHQSGFELDAGPNTIAATPEVLAFFKSLGLEDKILVAAAAGKKRFLVRNNQLHAVSPHPFKIMGSPYLSRGSKWKLFTERFRKPAPAAGEESVSSFVARRFNKEIAEYVFDPVLSGIYAGNPDLMSVGEVLPALPRWEREYGSVTKGLMKEKEVMAGRKIISFKGGNEVLVIRLQELLQTPVRFGCNVKTVTRKGDSYEVAYEEKGTAGTLTAQQVIFTGPAYTAADQIATLDAATAALLQDIVYPRMGVMHLGFNTADISSPIDGFGFLVPHAEGLHFLGAICNSAIFPDKAPEGKTLLTVFIGGARQEHYFDQPGAEQLKQHVLREVSSLLGITAAPVMQHFGYWDKAIPQLNIGHAKLRAAAKAFEEKYPGLHLSGNYLQGVAIPGLLQHAATLAASLKKN